ncbi:Preprotein translocase subunit SecG [Candidatus Palibaumannia cicadellinicola]|uniref:Protein-export membrane protein SecG n=1 Tax=Candidatus Palibaumannia cicadellinicola TaxID=186490 RepID=A0A0K2BL93_9GAMM|nr:Preprotein translocase subunit SecG [Candidatus Baumannia cicadellinicola]
MYKLKCNKNKSGYYHIMLYQTLLILFLIVAVSLVALIILQQGSNIDNSFGSNASGTLFGSSGYGNFMTRMTALVAMIFFCLV